MNYIHRYIEKTIKQVSRSFPILYLGGPRQVGKTTILQYLAKSHNRRYVTLDKPGERHLAQTDPELFLQRFSPPVLIDEVQYAPQLFPLIKVRVDRDHKPGQYWLTGSQQFALMKNVQESLAGRVAILTLLGFSYGEINKLPSQTKPFSPENINDRTAKKMAAGLDLTEQKVFSQIFRGSFPAVWQESAKQRELFYDSYVQTYIDRDLSALFGITKLSEFHVFLRLCAARTGQLLNYSELARDANISVHAAREWLAILENTMHVYLLRPYYRNLSKRFIKSPKLYFLDTGLAAYLTQWASPETLAAGAMAGAFFETYVLSELIKSYLFRGQQPPVYFFRDKEGHEVDILIERNQKLYPIEIKRSATPHLDMAKQIRYLRSTTKFPIGHGIVLALIEQRFPLDRDTDAWPLYFIN